MRKVQRYPGWSLIQAFGPPVEVFHHLLPTKLGQNHPKSFKVCKQNHHLYKVFYFLNDTLNTNDVSFKIYNKDIFLNYSMLASSIIVIKLKCSKMADFSRHNCYLDVTLIITFIILATKVAKLRANFKGGKRKNILGEIICFQNVLD